MTIREHLLRLVRLMVDERDQVEIDEVTDGSSVTLCLSVAESDLGKVIGRKGRTARALRTLLAVREDKQQGRYLLEILD